MRPSPGIPPTASAEKPDGRRIANPAPFEFCPLNPFFAERIMPVPPIRPTAVAVYVFRSETGAADSAGPRAVELLQIRRSAKAASHHHSWQTVYGGIEPGETAVEAALRELREETGLAPARMFQVEYLETFYFRPTDSLLLMPVFGVEVPAHAQVTLNHEHDAFRWIPENQISTAFMWRTQREALGFLLAFVHHGSPAMEFVTIALPGG
jgi:dATP pyrophosphohydrolase